MGYATSSKRLNGNSKKVCKKVDPLLEDKIENKMIKNKIKEVKEEARSSVFGIIDFLNNAKELDEFLDELDKEINEIFSKSNADIRKKFIEATRDKPPEFFVWLCFLRAIFLRGKDISSSKAFLQIMEFSKGRNYYFDGFSEDLLPEFNPHWLYANKIKEILENIKKGYQSGEKFIEVIKSLANSSCDESLLYFELIKKFNSLPEIGNKVANAIVNEITWEINTLRSAGEKKFNEIIKEDWLRKIVGASCFNVMIDVHVINLFKEWGIKDVDIGYLIILGYHLNNEVAKRLFDRDFGWLDGKDSLFEKYSNFIKANLIEKFIWRVQFFEKTNKYKKTNRNK
jgi:hypothetical protein